MLSVTVPYGDGMKTKPHLSGFVSYAHDDAVLAHTFLNLMSPRCNILRQCTLDPWWDRRLLVGQTWRSEIEAAIEVADFGLLLLSPSFLASPFIVGVELPGLLRRPGNLIIPVGLESIDLGRADLRELDHLQIFRLLLKGEPDPRWFSELGGNNRKRFCEDLLGQMVERFEREGLIDE